jgi:hypothetical protein
MRLIALTLCAVLLTGCGAARMNDDEILPPEKGQGMIVMSTRYQDSCGGFMGSAALTVEILHDNKIERRLIPLINPLVKKDFDNPPGFFQMWKYPAGDLRFAEVTRTAYYDSGRATQPVDFQLRVEPGKVYYLGELFVDVQCSGVTLRAKDQRVRDAALFDQRMNVLKSTQFEYRLFEVR